MRSLARRLVRRVRRSSWPQILAPSARIGAARRAIRTSGLFDPLWYSAEVGALPEGIDPVEHFLHTGGPAGASPSPLFVTEWYVTQRSVSRHARFGPFVDYLVDGARRGLSPHPLISVRHYERIRPGAKDHTLGVLGDYLDDGWRHGVSPHPDLDLDAWTRRHPNDPQPPLLSLARRGGALLRDTRGTEGHPRTVDRFDHAASDRFVANVRSQLRAETGQMPLVTVVLPTRNRAQATADAVRSVLAQTYPDWQLVVSDDGSTDATETVLAPLLADPRVEYVRRAMPGGVSVARNAALARARGEYVAYLDSDNTWVPHFLEVMVGVLRSTSARVAYAVSELRESGGRRRVAWRAGKFDREALAERNYIDCIVVVHERSLLDEVGRFDETLRRAVDWDLLIRMSKVADFAFAPFVATIYDPWQDDGEDRITTTVPIGYRNAVVAKHLVDWEVERARSRDAALLSVLIPAVGDADHLVEQVRRLAVTTGRWEAVLVDPAGDVERLFRLLLLQEQIPGVRVERVPRRLSPELAVNVGLARSNGADVAILGPGVRVERGWERPLREALRGGAVAAQGLLLQANGTVESAGVAFDERGEAKPVLRGVPGDAPEALVPGTRSALTAQFLAATASDLVTVQGFDGLYSDDLANGDLSLRLAATTGRPLAFVPAAVAATASHEVNGGGGGVSGPPVARRIFRERWQGRLPVDAATRWSDAGYELTAASGHGAFSVARRRDGKPPRWALKIGAPTVARRESWGDWHFAVALKDALERLGQEVVVDCRDAWYRDTTGDDDVVLALRGVSAYEPDHRHVNLLWIISHPEQVTVDEVSAFDHVFAASDPWAAEATVRLGAPVEVFLQCADAIRFRPVEPDPVHRHPVLFVGNARGLRPSVKTAIDAGLDVAVYGLRWEGLLPPGWWRAPYVPNNELPALYRAAGVVLNDHWDDMRTRGFLSNRLFDLAACGARIVTDDIVGVHAVFGPSVHTFDSPSSMFEAVRRFDVEDPQAQKERDRLSERIRREHSFDARAARLVEVAAELRAGEPAGSGGRLAPDG